jgi:hypothetical protein
MFLALASLGTVFVTPYFVEALILGSVFLIIIWKKVNDKILAPLHLDDKATTFLILISTIIGVNFLFKGNLLFFIIGVIYVGASFCGLTKYLKCLYQIDRGD